MTQATNETSAENSLALRTTLFPLSLCALAARHSLIFKGIAENSAARPHDARGPRRCVHCKTIRYREFVAAVALCVVYTVAFRFGIATLTAPVVQASPLACPSLPPAPPAALRGEADFQSLRIPPSLAVLPLIIVFIGG